MVWSRRSLFLVGWTILLFSVGMLSGARAAETEPPCGSMDPDCSRRLARVLNGIHVGDLEVSGGVRFGNGPLDGAIRFGIQGVTIDAQAGDLSLLAFETLYFPGEGIRIRITTVEADTLFFCRSEDGSIQGPISSFLAQCEPNAYWAMGGSALSFQVDPGADRWAARWLELQAVLNVLGNGTSVEYLRQRLSIYLGASLDQVSSPTESGVYARGKFGVSGLIRSRDQRYEVQGFAGVRPNLVQWDDWAVEARLKFLSRILVGRSLLLTPGVDVQYTHWENPERSIGEIASLNQKDALYVGLLFGLTF